MKIISILCLLFLVSCAGMRNGPAKSGASKLVEYSLTDISGQFIVRRSVIQKNGKIFTKTQLYSADEPDRELEKSLTVSSLGSLKSNNGKKQSSRPKSSQFEVWYDGKKHFSQLVINPQKRKLEVLARSPIKAMNGAREYNFPKGSNFCFFSQIPECLKSMGYIRRTMAEKDGSADFYIIWDSFPFQREQFSGLSKKPFSAAKISYEGEQDGGYRYALTFEGQSLFYHFGKGLDLDKMFWVAQGITLTRMD